MTESSQEPKYRHKRLRDLREMARGCFTEHGVTEIGPGHWTFARPGSSTYACHIVVGYSAVVVWGDIGPCGWQYGPQDPLEALRWVTSMRGSYLEEKASIFFSRGRGNILEFDHDALAEDLKDFQAYLVECIEEQYDKEDMHYGQAIAAINRAFDEWEINRLENGTEVYRYFAEGNGYEELREYFFDLWELVEGYTGEVLRADVIYCQEAVAALYKALRGDEE